MTPNIQVNKNSDKLPSKLTAKKTNKLKNVSSENNKLLYIKKRKCSTLIEIILIFSIENIKRHLKSDR